MQSTALRFLFRSGVGVGAAIALSIACSSTGSESGTSTGGDRASGIITASGGGTIQTSGGIVLEVPPGALDRDVTITVIALDAASAPDAALVAGARFEPDGLALKKAATLKLPLPASARGKGAPRELFFHGSDPRQASETGVTADVSDGVHAVLPVWHFSGNICATNCHGGTREYLGKQFAAKGLNLETCVGAKYSKDILPTRCDEDHSARAVQGVLGTFFDEAGSCCDAGTDISAEQIKQITDAVARGQNVVLAFHRDAFGGKTAADSFYPAIAHTATVEVIDGVPMLRNTVVVSDAVLKRMGGTNLAYWPLSDVNNFRKLPAGVALEMAACKDLPESERPGCIFPQPLAERPKPWTAVRIFIERATPHSCVAPDAGTTDGGNDSGKCPEYAPNTVGFCGGENDCPAGAPCACGGQFCCSEGFCYTRDIAGCTQTTCPAGAGRTYTGHCCCDCWDDKSKVNVYDPCRAGFLLRCDPAP